MSDQSNRKRLPGMIVGSLIAISFGTVFVMVNSGGLPGPWPLVIRVPGLLVAAALVVWLFRAARTAPPVPTVTGEGFVDRRYWLIVAAEAVALFGGLYVINGLLRRPALRRRVIAVGAGGARESS